MMAQRVSVQSQEETSLEIRNRIVIDHLPLVKSIAIRVHENLPVHIELDDLIHAGVLGLFDAVDKFDAAKNVDFQAYAKHRIKGAILDSLRQLDWASRDMRRRQKQADTVSRDFSAKFGRTPDEAEVAEKMGVTTERWRRMAMELRNAGPVSTSPREDLDRAQEMEFAAASDVRPDNMCERRELRITLERAIGQLPARYQKVVFLYYTNQMTMKQIGDLLGVNESRVSQIHKVALKKMQGTLASEGICSASAL
jgi:RNA polymerase sigma factor for flagellar operon FliA